jgi:ribosome-associated protein
MAEVLHVAPGVEIPLAEVEVRASRSSGPGGQHANVTASRIEASFDVWGSRVLTGEQKARLARRAGSPVAAVAQDARGQARNRELALRRLREKLAAGLREPKRRRATRPTAASKRRRAESKRRRSQKKALRRRVDFD